jgi:hypothetical protein
MTWLARKSLNGLQALKQKEAPSKFYCFSFSDSSSCHFVKNYLLIEKVKHLHNSHSRHNIVA